MIMVFLAGVAIGLLAALAATAVDRRDAEVRHRQQVQHIKKTYGAVIQRLRDPRKHELPTFMEWVLADLEAER